MAQAKPCRGAQAGEQCQGHMLTEGSGVTAGPRCCPRKEVSPPTPSPTSARGAHQGSHPAVPLPLTQRCDPGNGPQGLMPDAWFCVCAEGQEGGPLTGVLGL